MFEEYDELARRFTYEIEMEFYLNNAGLKHTLNTSEIFERYAPLFTEQQVRTFKNAARNYVGEEREIARRLYLFTCENYLENAVKTQRDKLLTQEASRDVEFEGEKIPFRLLSTKIHNEKDREKRKKLHQLEISVIHELNPLHVEIINGLHERAEALGYKNYCELYKELKNVDFMKFKEMLDNFLASTERIYRESMEKWLSRYGLSLAELERHDIPFVFSGIEFERYFPAEKLISELSGATANLGMDIMKLRGKERNVILDLEERPRKSARAFVSPVDPPFEIYMVVMPQGGASDYLSAFHEAGHALHYAFVLPMLPFVYKKMGEPAVSESYAFLFEYLLTNPAFVGEKLKEGLAEYLEYQMVQKLYLIRRYIGKFKYELRLHTAKDVEDMGKVYREEMEKALYFRHAEEIFLADIDSGFYSVDYLRAWIFEPMLRGRLKQLFGERWFENEKAGKYLQALWSVGEKHSVEELAKALNYDTLEPKYLEEEFREVLMG